MNCVEILKEGLKIFYKHALPFIIQVGIVIGLLIYLLELVRFYHFDNLDSADFWFPATMVSIITFLVLFSIMEAGHYSLREKNNQKKKKAKNK